MIRPPGIGGAAFGNAGDGDGRRDRAARTAISRDLGITDEWAYVDQVHGRAVVRAQRAGALGKGDAVYSTIVGLPMTIATADCVPIVVRGGGVAGVIHAGWRGLDAGVVEATVGAIGADGLQVTAAAIGPSIGPCCYEVGDDVAERFEGFTATTTSGGRSVDLGAVAANRLGEIDVWMSGECTLCGDGYNSYRRDGTAHRQVAVAWLPAD